LIERAYFIIGNAYLAKGMPNEALRYLSKSLAITKTGDRRPWFRGLSDAYAKAGTEDKAKEYDAKANPPKKWGEARASEYVFLCWIPITVHGPARDPFR
jgi:tetratricopeptide (TPR) repeat protein